MQSKFLLTISQNAVPLRPMRKWLGCTILCGLFLLTACKSNYEKIRTSGNQELILRKAFEYYEKKEYTRSQALFDLVLNSIKATSEAEKAYFYYAYTYYYQKQYVLGAYYFKNFSNTFTNSTYREEATFMSAYCNYSLSPSYRLDQTNTQKAVEEFQLFVNLFPESKRVEECNRLIDEMRRKLEQKSFAEGELYFKLRQYQSAVLSFDNLLRDYPESREAEEVRYLMAKSSYLLSENSIVEKKEERYGDTAKRCDDFLDKYPNGKYAKEIKEMKKDAVEKGKAAKKLVKKSA